MRNIYREELLDKAEFSIFKLVIAATKRALEVAEGAPRLVDTPLHIKPTTVALMELAEGKIRCKKAKK